MTTGGPADGVVLGLPQGRLRPYVDRYIGYRERADLPLVRREAAGAFVVLILGWGAPLDVIDPRSGERSAYGVDTFVAGTFDRWCRTETVGVGEGVQVLLAPLTARRILGLPMVELANRAVDVTRLPGGWLERLRQRLAETSVWTQRFALLDAAFAARLAASVPADPRIAWAWQQLTGSDGRVGIGLLADELGWSRRHLAARFRHEVGLPPKTTARLLRFQRAYAALAGPLLSVAPDPGRGPVGGGADVAARYGYYDQSHLIRDFREFAGDTPAALLAGQSTTATG
ncbi:AraC family transcriptional regulator [Micromonospora musae]|uniref:AraC family transcriptional regulator n=1 Tax=Micromonospora musae TaxID=1894970 RepID=A0ABX9R8P0_9ACTN|nr:helix-turn-helix domain-containing protein [Micromonospora musae]RKN18728.1 AraC family transcriptional regulator [Micromonospora musae]